MNIKWPRGRQLFRLLIELLATQLSHRLRHHPLLVQLHHHRNFGQRGQ